MRFGQVVSDSSYAFFSKLLPYVLPQVTTCSNMMAEQNIRRAAIDLCQKSRVWRTTQHPLPLENSYCEYEFEPDDGADRVQIEWVTYEGRRLEPTTEQRLFFNDREWVLRRGEPTHYFEMNSGYIRLWPTPNDWLSAFMPGMQESRDYQWENRDELYPVAERGPCSIVVRISQRPHLEASGMDAQVMEDHYNAIVNGALSYLMYMPGKEWSNPQLAQQYEIAFGEGINKAHNQSIDGNLQPVRIVRYGGL